MDKNKGFLPILYSKVFGIRGSLEIPLLSLAGGGQDKGGAHHHPQLRLGLRPPGLHPAGHPRSLLLLPGRSVWSSVGAA